MVYFNVHRVIRQVALIKQQQLAKQIDNTKDTKKIIQWASRELSKAFEMYGKRKAAVIIATAEKLERAGVQAHKICSIISKELSTFVDDSYCRSLLDDKYKAATKAINNAKKSVNIHAFPTNKPIPESYELDKSESYSKEYLIDIIKYQAETIQINCSNANRTGELTIQLEDLQVRNEELEARIKELEAQ